ncbi:hypothetical protein [Sphingobium aromaticiconvertens]|uniref:hypothetical protein n=1 Tax=Sphingobium aromaticiconvertens TaxID=365341 RepID=UPI00301B1263
MTMAGTTLATVVFSAVPILLLCIGDPKRRRSVKKSDGMAKGMRRLLVAIAVIPGIVCAAAGDSAAFLMWLGGCALLGWAATFCFRVADRSSPQPGITD